MSSFYALIGSGECWGIQILTIRYFNSFGSYTVYSKMFERESMELLYKQQLRMLHSFGYQGYMWLNMDKL